MDVVMETVLLTLRGLLGSWTSQESKIDKVYVFVCVCVFICVFLCYFPVLHVCLCLLMYLCCSMLVFVCLTDQ